MVESTAGKLAVANVTINRAADKNYPNTICGVVQEGIHYYNVNKDKHFPVRDRCQFSWYCDGYKDIITNQANGMKELIKYLIKIIDL